MTRLSLVYNGATIGDLEQDRHGATRLTAPPLEGVPRISLAFAPSTQPISVRKTRAYIEGLLPDGAARDRIARVAGVSPENPFALLQAIGRDCPGAIQFLPADEDHQADEGGLIPVSERDIADRLRPLRADSRAPWIRPGENWSLAGTQSKFALRRDGETWFEAHGNQATTHIIKPGIAGYSSQALLEHVSMRSLHHVGIDVAHTEFLRFGDQPAIVITRFDRAVDEDGTVYRLHQEDFCQATSRLPGQKYDVTAEDIAAALRSAGTPEVDIDRLIHAVLANWILGAPDGHGKNYSALIADEGFVGLAPLYDVSTAFGVDGFPQMAMGIGGEKGFDEVSMRNLASFAASMNRDPAVLRSLAADFARLMPSAFHLAISEVADEIVPSEQDLLDRSLTGLENHCRRILSRFGHRGGA